METRRAPNRRGEGTKLREEILEAARALVEEGGEQSVSLRAVARGIGIAAPSIYAHFADREAIVSALVDEAFEELSEVIVSAMDREIDPVARLRSACAAYVEFAIGRPNRYQLAFAAREANSTPRASATRTFELLVDAVHACIEAGSSLSKDAFGDATAIWVALHGYATQRSARPAFPWPATEATLARIVDGLAVLITAPRSARKPKRRGKSG
jgi:AcrR family transcriptional regulator